jgi:glycosyltransferase involved in cell wall biosynthesis
VTAPVQKTWPTVTVAVPVLNEELYLKACLDSIAAQRYSGQVEILVVDGGSVDRSRSIAARYPQIRLLDNPERTQAAALNLALAAARGEIFVRVDGHSVIAPDFVERSVVALEETGAAMVGAAVHPSKAGSWLQRTVAAAFVSPFGGGPAAFRRGGRSRWVDTVFLPSFRTVTALAVEGYNEDRRVNEDYEFAYRMRSHGGIWYEQGLRSTYFAPTSLTSLARQYFRYGGLRAAMVRRHPRSLSPRQLLPPLFVCALVSPRRGLALRVYAALLAVAASREAVLDPPAGAGLIAALPCMHVAWAAGFILGLGRPQGGRARR